LEVQESHRAREDRVDVADDREFLGRGIRGRRRKDAVVGETARGIRIQLASPTQRLEACINLGGGGLDLLACVGMAGAFDELPEKGNLLALEDGLNARRKGLATRARWGVGVQRLDALLTWRWGRVTAA